MSLTPEYFQDIVANCKSSPIGKLLPKALYVHYSALVALPPLLQAYEHQAREIGAIEEATLIKFSTEKPQISYLCYPEFDSDAHPALHSSIIVDLAAETATRRDYSSADNHFILHRKETFVTPDYPHYEEFAHLTRLEVVLGLLDKSRTIGTRQQWESLLTQQRLAFVGHALTCPLPVIQVERHKAAIPRNNLSRPVRLALEAGLFASETATFFDYGCGYGRDFQYLTEQGYVSRGWDPYYYPDAPKQPADIVNLGYVINVIENQQERRHALLEAWELARQLLIVSAQVLIDDRDRGMLVYGDGIITNRNTFQKYYEQEELKTYIDQVLSVDAIPAGLGVYFVFRDATQAEAFRVSRFHSSARTPRICAKVRRFEDYESLLLPLMEFMTERGRLPLKGELANEMELKAEFGTFHRAFQTILQVTLAEDWDAITVKRRQDLLLYLALSHFDRRPRLQELSPEIKGDIKKLFGGYQPACFLADMMLLNLRDLKNVARLCRSSPVGKKLRNALLIHVSAIDSLETLLRLYEGCANRTFGRLEEANVIKLFFDRPKISYLCFPDFDTDPQPKLKMSMSIYLGDVTFNYRDFSGLPDPPILKNKEALLMNDEL
jgi:DNA phosphorothioation-associated putative methyltransferase